MNDILELLEDTNWALNNMLAILKMHPNKYPGARHEIETGVKQLNERAHILLERHRLAEAPPGTQPPPSDGQPSKELSE